MAFVAAPRKKQPAPQPNRGIIKQNVTKIPVAFYVNASAGFVATLIVVLAIRGVLYSEPVAPCSDRLDNGTVFGLQDKSGGAVSASDLQARLAGRDWGVLDNARVIALKDGPAPVALTVALPKLGAATAGSSDAAKLRSGMGFTWLPSKLSAANSACLTYDVWLPTDFDFGRGGALPGLFGGETAEVPVKGMTTGFVARQAWGEGGAALVRTFTHSSPNGTEYAIDPDRLRLDRGRWIRLEQEVVLNDPGQENGILRVWVDGKIRHDEQGLVFRKDERSQFRGVTADVHYGDNGSDAGAIPKETSLRITPFVVRWQ
jgi:hypothetical protein